MSYEINKIIFLIFSLTFCQHSYSKCIPISFESDNSVYKRISYYSLQGDTKKVEKEPKQEKVSFKKEDKFKVKLDEKKEDNI